MARTPFETTNTTDPEKETPISPSMSTEEILDTSPMGLERWENDPLAGMFHTAAIPEEAKSAKTLTKKQLMEIRFAAEPISGAKIAGIIVDLVNTFLMATAGQAIYSQAELDAFFDRPPGTGNGDYGDRPIISASAFVTSGEAFENMIRNLPDLPSGPGGR